jgi:hypothetical protein
MGCKFLIERSTSQPKSYCTTLSSNELGLYKLWLSGRKGARTSTTKEKGKMVGGWYASAAAL